MSNEELMTAALQLSPPDRASLARQLLSSLQPQEGDLDEVWVAKAELRLQEVLAGEIVPISANEAMLRIHRAIG